MKVKTKSRNLTKTRNRAKKGNSESLSKIRELTNGAEISEFVGGLLNSQETQKKPHANSRDEAESTNLGLVIVLLERAGEGERERGVLAFDLVSVGFKREREKKRLVGFVRWQRRGVKGERRFCREWVEGVALPVEGIWNL